MTFEGLWLRWTYSIIAFIFPLHNCFSIEWYSLGPDLAELAGKEFIGTGSCIFCTSGSAFIPRGWLWCTEVDVVEVYADVDDIANLVKEFYVGYALAVVIFDSNCFKPATNEWSIPNSGVVTSNKHLLNSCDNEPRRGMFKWRIYVTWPHRVTSYNHMSSLLGQLSRTPSLIFDSDY